MAHPVYGPHLKIPGAAIVSDALQLTSLGGEYRFLRVFSTERISLQGKSDSESPTKVTDTPSLQNQRSYSKRMFANAHLVLQTPV